MATRIYEFGEGGHIDAIKLPGDDLVRRNDPFAVASLREPGILQRFSQLVFHYPIVAREVRLQERADQIAVTMPVATLPDDASSQKRVYDSMPRRSGKRAGAGA